MGAVDEARLIDELYKRGVNTVHVTSHIVSEALMLLTFEEYRVIRSYSQLSTVGYFAVIQSTKRGK